MLLDSTKRWYAVYTKSRTEKKVAEVLEMKGLEVYLPLQKTMKQWSDRRKIVYEPLFRSYVFVKVNNKDYMEVLKTRGAVRYVTIGGERVAIPECQIQAVKTYLGEIALDEEYCVFNVGENVEVAYGSLRGLKGELKSAKNQRKLIVQIDAVYQNITITIPSNLLKKIPNPTLKT